MLGILKWTDIIKLKKALLVFKFKMKSFPAQILTIVFVKPAVFMKGLLGQVYKINIFCSSLKDQSFKILSNIKALKFGIL